MKKLILIMTGAWMIFTLSACQKYYSCRCTLYGITTSQDWSDLKTEVKNYRNLCDHKNENAEVVGGHCVFHEM